MWLSRLWIVLLSTSAWLTCTSTTEVTASENAPSTAVHEPASASSLEPMVTTNEDNDWSFLRRFYDGSPPTAQKRAYRYVSEFKRLPVYNFGLGKRSDSGNSRMYAFGLGKRDKNSRQYAFGLGKRPNMYAFGLGKRSMDYAEDEDDTDDDDGELLEPDVDAAEMSEEKRAGSYSFGLGKRYPQGVYSFGLGKRAPRYEFGLGKRFGKNMQYGFGLGKRLPQNNRQYSFGLGKREVSAADAAAVAAEQHSIKRRSADWTDVADARLSRANDEDAFERPERRSYSFEFGKRYPLYNFGVGKRLARN